MDPELNATGRCGTSDEVFSVLFFSPSTLMISIPAVVEIYIILSGPYAISVILTLSYSDVTSCERRSYRKRFLSV
jgi:hypothetical protein